MIWLTSVECSSADGSGKKCRGLRIVVSEHFRVATDTVIVTTVGVISGGRRQASR